MIYAWSLRQPRVPAPAQGCSALNPMLNIAESQKRKGIRKESQKQRMSEGWMSNQDMGQMVATYGALVEHLKG